MFTDILTKFLGAFWIALGIWWLIQPTALRTWFRRKISRKARITLFGFAVIFGIHLLGVSVASSGILPKIAGFFGILLLLKGFILMTSKTLDEIAEGLAGLSLDALRLWAAGIFVAGILVFYM